MADSKISALTEATTLADTDEFVIASGGASKKVTWANMHAGCKAWRNSNFSHNSSGNFLAVDLDTEVWDTDAFHSTVTNTSRITIPTGLAGRYMIVAHAGVWDTDTSNARIVEIRKNGSSRLNADLRVASNQGVVQSVVAIDDLAEGDYVEMRLYQNSGGTRTVTSDGVDDLSLSVEKLD